MTANDIIAYSFLALWFLFLCGVLLWMRIEKRKTIRKATALFKDFIYTQERRMQDLEWQEMIGKHKRKDPKKIIEVLEHEANEILGKESNK
jgi:hypothetical protein